MIATNNLVRLYDMALRKLSLINFSIIECRDVVYKVSTKVTGNAPLISGDV